MMRRPFAAAHVVLLGFAMAACGAEKPAVAPVPRFEPVAALAEASTFIAEGAYRFEIVTFGPGVSGTIHVPTRSAEIESTEYRQGVEVRTRARYVGAKSFINIRMSGGRFDEQRTMLPVLKEAKDSATRKQVKLLEEMYEMFGGRYWMPYDREQTSIPAVELGTPDALGVKAIIDSATDLTGTPAQITGTVQADDVVQANHLVGRLSVAALKPGSGLPIPITVTINPDKTIAELGMAMPGNGSKLGSGWKVRFLDHRDAPPVPAPPASDVKKPSDALMEVYRNGGTKG
jgi:hypothetical protein